MTQRARLRIEFTHGNFMTGKVIDVNTGLAIPVKSIKIDVGVDNWRDGIWATIVVPIDEIYLDDIPVEIEADTE